MKAMHEPRCGVTTHGGGCGNGIFYSFFYLGDEEYRCEYPRYISKRNLQRFRLVVITKQYDGT